MPKSLLADEIETTVSSREEEGYEEEGEAYEFPEIKPDLSVSTGYRFVGVKGSARASEYEYLHNSVTLGEELRFFSFPHRLHLDVDLKNKKDFLGEATYAYQDIFYFRGINRTLFHNLDNITLNDLDPSTPSPGVRITDAGVKYGVKTGMSSLFLRFKTPDFPSHFYVDASLIERKGIEQQISLAGSGYRNDSVRKSSGRDIDWQTRNVVLGVNSHLGPIELDISHSEKRFEVSGDKVLYENYTAADSTPARAAGRYPHNMTPELIGSSDTIKIHTSYTGGLVATATLSRIDRENNDSGAKADYLIGAGEIIWMPMTKLAFFLKYRHKETDVDNPGTVTLRDITDPSNSYTYSVRPSISSKTDLTSLTARYRMFPFLTLRPEYTYETIDRENANLWALPDSTRRQTFSLFADSRIMRPLSLKLSYTHKEIDNPAYNTEPDRSDEGRMAISWTPLKRINTLLAYSVAGEKRDNISFVDSGNLVIIPDKRDVIRDKAFGSISFILRDDLSLSTSFANMHSRTRQDLGYRFSSEQVNLKTDPLVPYRENSQNYAADVNYMPRNNINLSTGISHTISNAKFFPSSGNLTEPVSIASFSDLKTKETVYLLSGEYKMKDRLKIGTTYKFCTIKDATANPFDDLQNGTVHILMVTVTKGF